MNCSFPMYVQFEEEKKRKKFRLSYSTHFGPKFPFYTTKIHQVSFLYPRKIENLQFFYFSERHNLWLSRLDFYKPERKIKLFIFSIKKVQKIAIPLVYIRVQVFLI